VYVVGWFGGWLGGWLVGWLVLWVIKDMGVGEWGGVYSIYLVGDLVGDGFLKGRNKDGGGWFIGCFWCVGY